VTIGVGTSLGTRCHILVGGVYGGVVAGVDPVLAGVLGQGGVAFSLKTVWSIGGRAGTEINWNICELLPIVSFLVHRVAQEGRGLPHSAHILH
jgi:hypothetical protein